MTDSPRTGGSPSRPQPPTGSITIALIAVGRALETRMNADLERLGLSLRRIGALGHLTRDPGLSYTELAHRARVTPQSMHATIGGLIGIGAVRPAESGRGRRALLEVTPEGQRLLADARAVLAAADDWIRDAEDGIESRFDRAVMALALRLAHEPDGATGTDDGRPGR